MNTDLRAVRSTEMQNGLKPVFLLGWTAPYGIECARL